MHPRSALSLVVLPLVMLPVAFGAVACATTERPIASSIEPRPCPPGQGRRGGKCADPLPPQPPLDSGAPRNGDSHTVDVTPRIDESDTGGE